MSLVKFINDSEPYLSAENLNNNFEELGKRIYIEESGSNNNGSYIKFSDGNMVCWHSISGRYNVTSQANGCYYTNQNFTFPQEFKTRPVIIPSLTEENGILWAGLGIETALTNTVCQVRALANVSISDKPISFMYVAIGKWK